jgi:hypothetical protein
VEDIGLYTWGHSKIYTVLQCTPRDRQRRHVFIQEVVAGGGGGILNGALLSLAALNLSIFTGRNTA